MSSLTPGAIYIYEKANSITYAREFGAPHSQRFEIDRDSELVVKNGTFFKDWYDVIPCTGRHNPYSRQ